MRFSAREKETRLTKEGSLLVEIDILIEGLGNQGPMA